MRNFKFNCVLLSVVLAFPVASFAASSLNRNLIKSIVVHDFGDAVLVQTATPTQSQEVCRDKDWLVLKKSHVLFKEMYAALLATYHANGAFSGWVNGCDTGHGLSAPVLLRVDLIK